MGSSSPGFESLASLLGDASLITHFSEPCYFCLQILTNHTHVPVQRLKGNEVILMPVNRQEADGSWVCLCLQISWPREEACRTCRWKNQGRIVPRKPNESVHGEGWRWAGECPLNPRTITQGSPGVSEGRAEVQARPPVFRLGTVS